MKVKKTTRNAQKTAKKTAKKPANSTQPLVLAYDLGGTKVSVGVVNLKGEILRYLREPVMLKLGKEATLAQLITLGKRFIQEFPGIRRAGIASAGPLNPITGELLDPTNFKSDEGTWGIVPISEILAKGLGIPVSIENDAAAALLAEKWMGHAKDVDNAMILTLGTGLGTAAIVNGELVRSGNYMHTEAGHIIVRAGDETAPCGCGNLGCAEAYLSGKTFTYRARKILDNSQIDAPQIAARARMGGEEELKLFEEYSEILAVTLHNFANTFGPEVVILTGSFAAAWDLFLEKTRVKLRELLKRRLLSMPFLMPRIEVSTLENQAGLLGGAYVAVRTLEKQKIKK